MPRYKVTDPATGEEFHIDWAGDSPPTQDQAYKIINDQRASKVATKQKIAEQSKSGFFDRLLMSPEMGVGLKVAGALGLDQPWHPIDSLKDIGAGMQRVIQGGSPQGQLPAQYPRVAGAAQAVRGALGVMGPPGEAAGLALAPEVTLPAVAAGNLTSQGTAAALRNVDLPPEVKDIASTGAGLVAGGLTGHAMSRMMPKVSPPATSPEPLTGRLQTTEMPKVLPPVESREVGPLRPRVNWSQVDPVQRTPGLGPPQGPPPIVTPPPEVRAYAPAQDETQVVSPSDQRTQAPPRDTPINNSSTVQVRPPNATALATAAPDLVSQVERPPIAPTEVSTVRGSSPQPAGEPAAPEPPSAPQVTPPIPSAPKPVAQVPVTPPAQQAPGGPPQQPQVKPPIDLKAVLAKAKGAQAPQQPQQAPAAPPQVQPPQGQTPAQIPPQLSQVRPPQQVQAPEMPQLPQPQQVAARANNVILDLLKRRQNVTIDQAQRVTGLPGDVVKKTLQGMQTRGLITQRAGKYNYVPAQGEELPSATAEEPETPKPAAETQVSPKRQERISSLQQMIGQAEDEGDDFAVSTLRDHLKAEETNVQIEQRGSPEAKQALSEMDKVYDRIDQLEAKEKDGLSPDEEQELTIMYKKVNSLGELLNDLWKNESGMAYVNPDTGLPMSRNPVRNYFARRKYIEEHGIDRAPNAIETEFGRKNQVLQNADNIDAAIIGTKVPEVEVKKLKFIGTYKRLGADIHKNLNSDESKQVWQVLNMYENPEQARGYSPKVINAAIDTRDLLDKVHKMFPEEATKAGGKVGYIKGYVSHMRRVASGNNDIANAVEDIIKYHLAPLETTLNLFKRPIEGGGPGGTNIYGEGIGKPGSPFVEKREGDLTDLETDIRKVFPAYIEGAGKVIYDKPLIEQMAKHLAKIPEGRTADIAKSYLQNYARYDSFPGMDQDWNSWTGRLMRMHARAVLGLSTRLVGLHAGRLMGQILPEVPMKYWAEGAKALAHPIENYNDLGRRGVLPQNSSPWLYKKPMEKYESMLRFFDAGDAMSDVVGWHALNAMYKDKGFSEVDAGNMATNRLMDLSMRMTPARMANLFTRQSGILRPFLQYKQQILGIAEQYVRASSNIVKQRQLRRFMRYFLGGALLYAVKKKLGLTVTHFNPMRLGQLTAGAYDIFNFSRRGTPAYKASHGDISGALKDLGLYASGLKNPLKEIQKPSILEPAPEQ